MSTGDISRENREIYMRKHLDEAIRECDKHLGPGPVLATSLSWQPGIDPFCMWAARRVDLVKAIESLGYMPPSHQADNPDKETQIRANINAIIDKIDVSITQDSDPSMNSSSIPLARARIDLVACLKSLEDRPAKPWKTTE